MFANAAQKSSVIPRRRSVAALFLALLLLLTLAVWFAAYRYFVSEELARADGRLSLYRSTVLAEIERFEHLTQVLSVDPFVIGALSAPSSQALNLRLASIADAAGLDAIFLMRPDGQTIAASNAGTAGSFMGENYAFRPYFQDALAGQRGQFYGIGATTGLPGYFISDPVLDATDRIIGVVAIKIDLSPFEESWRTAGEDVLLADAQDVVLLASEPSWRYRTFDPLSAQERQAIADARQFTGQPLELLDWRAEGQRAWIDGNARLHVETRDLPFGWQLHYLSSDAAVVNRAWLAAGSVLVLAALLLIAAQYQRGQRLRQALSRSEANQAELRQANDRLAGEIEDRRRAERRLRETRAELERTSRLAALGQLAASVTHELGQPIAAMKNHLAAFEMARAPQEGRLAGMMGSLVDRMEGITRQLKFFARSDVEPFEDIDLRDVIAAVLDLMGPFIEAGGATLNYRAPDRAVPVRGSRLRLEQVLTNLIRNALDAMEDSPAPTVGLSVGTDEGTLWVEVTDCGHGLGAATIENLAEPFFSTRESGKGLGLGLAISAGILADHGGRLDAANQASGGAVFRMILPVPQNQELAAE